MGMDPETGRKKEEDGSRMGRKKLSDQNSCEIQRTDQRGVRGTGKGGGRDFSRCRRERKRNRLRVKQMCAGLA